ncbi:hypothetical protein HC762_00115 [bacterium]|nr:hypothetical protein [bacterium]
MRDYHRENLLNGLQEDSQQVQQTTTTYNQGQEALKRSIIDEINSATAGGASDSISGDELSNNHDRGGFLVAIPQKEKVEEKPSLDVENADKDPETFLSNFLSARAWVPSEHSRFQPLESDDDDEDLKAQEFEEAYNFRFEDPAKSNERLVSHARDVAAKYSVRRGEKNVRKKQREAERERKEESRRERAKERARWRKLKIEEAEEKLRKIKKAAGLERQTGLSPEDLIRFLGADWSDAEWDEEMQKTLGEAYYAQDDASNVEAARGAAKGNRKPKKPKWDDDIDIADLIPDYDEGQPSFDLSDEPTEYDGADGSPDAHNGPRSAKGRKKDIQDKKQQVRKERKLIEQIVEDHLELDTVLADDRKNASGFRYRQTSPLSFGLSNRDILMAEDSQLNEYAGLKKLASFRDPSKKRKDQKRLGKKARLRQWRRDTFGDQEGATLPEKLGIEAEVEAGRRKQGGANTASPVDVDGATGAGAKKRKKNKTKKRKLSGTGGHEEVAAA